jgi:hypothetical protein
MASTFSNLGLNLQATGENSGTWGSITNVNLQEIDNAISGVFNLTITGSTTLAFTTNSSSTTFTDESGRNKTIILSGALSATTVTLSVPNIEKDYVIINNSGGTVTVSSGGSTTVSIGTGSKNYVIVDPSTTSVITAVPTSAATNPGGTTNAVQYNNAGVFAGSTNFTFDGTNVQIGSQGDLRLGDSDNSNYVALHAPTTITSNYTLTLPATTGSANQVIQTDGSGNLSFASVSGGAAWQAIKTADFNVTVKEGYFVDTTSTTITATLPASPTIGDFVTFIDYAGTFDTNNFTVGRNGNKIQGDASDLTVSVERAGLTLIYSGSSVQGWLLENK